MIVIINRRSGSPNDPDAQGATIETALRRHGLNPTIWEASSGEELVAAAARAARSPEQTIVVAGGDGTISTVCNELLPSQKRLGILPLGTLNHFAKDLGLPTDLEDAALTIATGTDKLVDVAEVNGRIFLNNSSLGLYPRIVQRREDQQKQTGRGKWTACAWAALEALHIYPTLHLRLHADGRELRGQSAFLFIGNNPYRFDWMNIGGRERLDTGLLGVYFARGAGRWEFLRMATSALFGIEPKNIINSNVRELQVEARESTIQVASDGEVHWMTTPLLYAIRPRALRVIVSSATVP